jgi:hypothetical protein
MKTISKFGIIAVAALLSACSSTSNVYDYYLKNVIEKHEAGKSATSKSKLLLRGFENTNKAQVEFIAFKTDTSKYLVLGSHKVVKSFYIQDSLYHFDVADLYSRVRGDDFIRQLGDLNIFFTHIPAANAVSFLSVWPILKNEYNVLKPTAGEVAYLDYAITTDVVLSFEKKSLTQQPKDCNIWIGKRKHTVSIVELIKVLTALKAFN